MGTRLKPWLFFSLLAVAIAAVLFAIHSFRHRVVRSDADLVALLPKNDMTVFFANVAGLRHADLLNLVSGSKPVTDAEYQQFIREMQFDYAKDLDALAGESDGKQFLFVLRGRFVWSKLQTYATAHGGVCSREECNVPASTPGRWASFFEIQPDVMALALSTDDHAVEVLRPHGKLAPVAMPTAPVWINISMDVVRAPVNLPAALRVFAICLQSVNSVVLSVSSPTGNSGAAFDLKLEAECRNATTADTARTQLELQTKMLKLELARERETPNAADLTGLLTAGTFQVVDKKIVGTWPVAKELLSSLQ